WCGERGSPLIARLPVFRALDRRAELLLGHLRTPGHTQPTRFTVEVVFARIRIARRRGRRRWSGRSGFGCPAESLSNLHNQAAEFAGQPSGVAFDYLLDVIKTVGHGSSVTPGGWPVLMAKRGDRRSSSGKSAEGRPDGVWTTHVLGGNGCRRAAAGTALR